MYYLNNRPVGSDHFDIGLLRKQVPSILRKVPTFVTPFIFILSKNSNYNDLNSFNITYNGSLKYIYNINDPIIKYESWIYAIIKSMSVSKLIKIRKNPFKQAIQNNNSHIKNKNQVLIDKLNIFRNKLYIEKNKKNKLLYKKQIQYILKEIDNSNINNIKNNIKIIKDSIQSKRINDTGNVFKIINKITNGNYNKLSLLENDILYTSTPDLLELEVKFYKKLFKYNINTIDLTNYLFINEKLIKFKQLSYNNYNEMLDNVYDIDEFDNFFSSCNMNAAVGMDGIPIKLLYHLYSLDSRYI